MVALGGIAKGRLRRRPRRRRPLAGRRRPVPARGRRISRCVLRPALRTLKAATRGIGPAVQTRLLGGGTTRLRRRRWELRPTMELVILGLIVLLIYAFIRALASLSAWM